MFRFALLVALLLAAVAAFAAEPTPDPHLSAPRTSAIVRGSAFVHGYLHGYEQGFHLADLDLQLGRSARDVTKTKEAKDDEAYCRRFGDQHFFGRGYREGLRVGYADGIAGRAFRAFTELEGIGAIVPQTAGAAAESVFDAAFSQGYSSGQRQGIHDGRNDASAASQLPPCPAGDAAARQIFCAAYAGGYRVGYSDGFTNVVRPASARLEARAGK